MKSKKAASTWTVVIGAALAIVVLFLGFFWFSSAGKQSKHITEIGPGADKLCKASSLSRGISNDIDSDGRDDGCDWCVCTTGCHNDDNDKDGDKLPDKCDADPDDQSVVGFNEDNCDEDHLNLKKTICRPS